MLVTIVNADWTKDMYDKSNNLYEKVKSKSIDLVTPVELSKEETKTLYLNKIWSNVFDDLEDGAEYIVELNNAPESAWISSDKKDIQEDINGILENMIDSMTGDDLLLYRNKIEKLKEKISENKKDILGFREKKINAPSSSRIYTTKANYESKIKEKKAENIIYENNIESVKENLKKNFSDIGVVLSSAQIEVLLVRVDGDDIIKMSLVMDVLRHITDQLMQLMQESNEELSQSKKYYGMHLITLELIVYIQQKYIDKVNNKYIPKINKIIFTSKNMISDTTKLRRSIDNNRMRSVYGKNLKTQKLALNASTLYKKDLLSSKKRMINAQNNAKANLTLARNTYRTVMLSAELYNLMTESQNEFSKVIKMQMPKIIPFENTQMKKKYNELTKSMRE
jgi:hypothetical protein